MQRCRRSDRSLGLGATSLPRRKLCWHACRHVRRHADSYVSHIVMAYIVMTYVVMAYIVMPYNKSKHISLHVSRCLNTSPCVHAYLHACLKSCPHMCRHTYLRACLYTYRHTHFEETSVWLYVNTHAITHSYTCAQMYSLHTS